MLDPFIDYKKLGLVLCLIVYCFEVRGSKITIYKIYSSPGELIR
jgi:hypothetical protein